MLKNLTIGVRLTLGFGLLAALLLGWRRWLICVSGTLTLRYKPSAASICPKLSRHAAIDQVNISARAIRNAMLVKTPDEAQKEFDRPPRHARKLPNCMPLDKAITSAEGRKCSTPYWKRARSP